MSFKFNDNKIKVSFDNASFVLDPVEASNAFKKSVPMLEKMKEEIRENADAETVKRILQSFCEWFDNLLGNGATKKIFRDHPISFYDCCDVYFYISGEVRSFNIKKRKLWGAHLNEHTD